MTQLHVLDGTCGHLLFRDFRHQFCDTPGNLASILVELILPEQASEDRAPQLQFVTNVPN